MNNREKKVDTTSARIISDLHGLIDENERLARENEEIKTKFIDISRFNQTALPVSAVAALHQKTTKTVHKYISYGLISKHPKSTDEKIYISTHEALTLDFKHLMRVAKVRLYHGNI